MTQKETHKISLDRLLECGVILNWDALMQTPGSSIQVEYRLGPDVSLEYLRVWTSTIRGTWNLICAYWMDGSLSHGIGLISEEGYQSAALGEILEFIAQRPEAFLSLPHRNGLVQVQAPTQQEVFAASTWMDQFLPRSLTPQVRVRRSNGQHDLRL